MLPKSLFHLLIEERNQSCINCSLILQLPGLFIPAEGIEHIVHQRPETARIQLALLQVR